MKKFTNSIRFMIHIILSIIIIISLIGQCNGLDIISKTVDNSIASPSGNLVSSDDEPSSSMESDDQKTEPTNDPQEEKTSEPSDNDPVDDTDDDSLQMDTKSDDGMTSDNIIDNNIIDESVNIDNETVVFNQDGNTINNTINYTNSNVDQIKNELDINYENLEYWLGKLNFTIEDNVLKSRLIELAKKSWFMNELKLKIINLVQDNSLTGDEKLSRFLRFVKSCCLNERNVSVEEIALKVEKQYDEVSNGKITLFNIDKSNRSVGVEKVQLVSDRDLSNVKVTIIKLKQKPEDIPLKLNRNESVYSYLDIKLTENDEFISDEDIETLNFTFNVNVSWIEEKNIDKSTIILIRYHDGEWLNLSTRILSENETQITFIAETEGCSTFAVVGSTLVEISEPYVSDSPDIPWTIIIAITSSTTILLGFVLIKARYIYIGEESINSKSKKK